MADHLVIQHSENPIEMDDVHGSMPSCAFLVDVLF
jgi:hypothetical protein